MSDIIKEEFRSDDGYSTVPDPVETGSTKLPNSNDNAEPMPKLSKAAMIGAIVSAAHRMDRDTLSAVYNATMKQAGLPTGNLKESAPSAGAIIKEDITELLGTAQDLSEEFRNKAATLFEAAVNAKVTAELAALEEKFDSALNDKVEQIKEEQTNQIDQYLTAVVAEWAKENEEKLKVSVRAEIAESFMNGLRDLLEEHYIEVPEEAVDVVEALSAKNDEIAEELFAAHEAMEALQEELAALKKKNAIAEASAGMTETQADRFAQLAEGLQFDDTFITKLNVIKESVVGVVKANAEQMLTEEVVVEEKAPKAPTIHPDVAVVLKGMSRLNSGR